LLTGLPEVRLDEGPERILSSAALGRHFMAEDLLNLQYTEGAKIAYSSLGPEDRRLVDAWFDHLRNWRNDEYIRSSSRRLDADEDVYVFQTGTDLVLAFKIVGDKAIILSIFRNETLRKFETTAERSIP
jgi:hypothetical protein